MYDHCGTLKNQHTIRKEQGMKFPVLWLAYVTLSVWVGTEKGVRLAWDLVSRSRITLHFGANVEKPKTKPGLLVVHFPKLALSNVVSPKGLYWVLYWFLLYINDLPNCLLTNSYPRMYADYTHLTFADKDGNILQSCLNEDLLNISK